MPENQPKFDLTQEDIALGNQFNGAVDKYTAEHPDDDKDQVQADAEQAAKGVVKNAVYEETYSKNGGSDSRGGEEGEPIEQDYEADYIAYGAQLVAEGKIEAGVPTKVKDMLEEAHADDKAFDDARTKQEKPQE